MEIRQLTYFLAVAREGSYSRAAERLEMSQPTLSVAIKKLEEELGVKLLYSFNRKQLLTDEGMRLRAGAEKILEDYQQTMENVVNSSEITGKLTLGLSPLFGACFFGDLLPGFNQEYPGIKISMIEDGAEKIEDLIDHGEVDIAVTLKTERTPHFNSCHFSTQKNVALLHKTHPLAGAKSIKVSDLRDDAFALFNQDFTLHRQIMDACHASGFRPKIALLSSQWDFMVEIVSKNRGVSIMPKPVMDKHPDPNVCCVPIVDSMKYWDIVLVWNKYRYMSRSCEIFLNYVTEHLPPDDL